MPKNKILIYLLSTTLVLPTLVSPTAYADTPQKDTTAKTTSHDSKKSNDDETSKDTTSKDIDKADNNNTSNQDNNDKKFKTIDDSTSDSNNIIDFIYKNLPQTNINQLLTKNKYDDNYSLTTLIQNLFNLNSDISDYEQPRNGEKSTNDSNKNSDNSIKNDTDTQSSKQDKADNQKAPKSNNTKPSTSNKQPNSPKPTQPNQSNSQPASDDKANQKSSSKDNQSMSDSALDSILDQYSEDAKKTQKDYASQSKKDKNEKSNTKNPQLPTQDELKHKSKPAQSFNNDVNQKDTRATSLFETDPSISNNDDSGQFNVVDSKDTRQFVKSIAKDAHRIGQDNDIYASVMIAQAILESDSGRSALAKSPNHNLFGIKGAFEGNSVPFNTLEADGNKLYSINAGF